MLHLVGTKYLLADGVSVALARVLRGEAKSATAWARHVLMISDGMAERVQTGAFCCFFAWFMFFYARDCRRVMLMIGGFAIIVLVYAFTGSPQSGFEHVRLRKGGDDTQLPVIDEVFTPTPGPLNEPHGGKLMDLLVDDDRKKEVRLVLLLVPVCPAEVFRFPPGKLSTCFALPKIALCLQIITELSPKLRSWTLTLRQQCDLELLMSGAFSPLDGFMEEDTYKAVVKDYRLGSKYNNLVWPMPITLDVDAKVCSQQ